MTPAARLELLLSLLAMDPAGLGGLWLRGRAGPLRDKVAARLAELPVPQRRLTPAIDDVALFGGLDAVATLAMGRPVMRRGVLGDPALLILPMAESAPAGLVARLAQALDAGDHAVIALDEAAEDGEGLAPALADRLGLFFCLDGLRAHELDSVAVNAGAIAAGAARLAAVRLRGGDVGAVVQAAAQLGVGSDRAVMAAVRVARRHAAWVGRTEVSDEDLSIAVELAFGHLAAPETAQPDATPPPPQPETDSQENDNQTLSEQDLSDMLIDAARAVLPPEVLRALAAGPAARGAKGATGTGAAKAGNRRGRPLPARPGRMDGRARLDLVATLRAAAPWQPLRHAQAASPRALWVEPGDLRVKRFKEQSDRVLIFAVDASGSSAVARLAEAKGAVELLLAQAYSRRDHVALVVFRGKAAEVLLPPTRSLVRTKASLRGVPGGGGTPLASGLEAALRCALAARARGMTPTIALLTDGRGNIALDGSAGRELAQSDAEAMARAVRAAGLEAVVLDVSNRPHPALAELSRMMAARYIPLPRADSRRIAATLG